MNRIKKSNINFKPSNKDIKSLLIINRHFWPDKSSCSAILFHLAKKFSIDIKNVSVITSKPKRFGSICTRVEISSS